MVSVIIPVYNVEKYLDRCVQSIVSQTHKDLEIILVDDGSPDNCPAICDKWAKKDSRIKVIHKENGGLSDARNIGVEHASGEWVYFIDSDDYLSPDAIEKLYRVALENGCEISMGRYVSVADGIEEQNDFTNKISIYDENGFWEYVYSLMLENEFDISVNFIISCNKLIKKEIVDEVKFPVGKLHEDEFVIHQWVSKCKKIAFLNSKLYYYVRHSDSIMGERSKQSVINAAEAFEQREKYFIDNNVPFLVCTVTYLLDFFIRLYFDAKEIDKKTAESIRSTYRKYYKLGIKLNGLKNEPHYRNNRQLFSAFCINEYLYRGLRKMKKVLNISGS